MVGTRAIGSETHDGLKGLGRTLSLHLVFQQGGKLDLGHTGFELRPGDTQRLFSALIAFLIQASSKSSLRVRTCSTQPVTALSLGLTAFLIP